ARLGAAHAAYNQANTVADYGETESETLFVAREQLVQPSRDARERACFGELELRVTNRRHRNDRFRHARIHRESAKASLAIFGRFLDRIRGDREEPDRFIVGERGLALEREVVGVARDIGVFGELRAQRLRRLLGAAGEDEVPTL